jgi:hypothetical protein
VRTDGRFFDLPATMDASVTKDGLISTRFPSEVYRIEIQDSGRRNTVEFDDNGDSTSEQVQRIRALAERLKRFLPSFHK